MKLYAAHRPSLSRWPLLPRDQSWQRAGRGISEAGGLRGVRRASGTSKPADTPATVGVLSDAESFSSGALAHRRRRFGALDAVASDGACPSLSSALSLRRPHLAGSIQGVSGSARRTSPHGLALHRAESDARRARSTGRRVAVVQRPLMERTNVPELSDRGTGVSAAELDRVRQRAANSGGVGAIATFGQSGNALWNRELESAHGRGVRLGKQPPPARATMPSHGEKVECPLFWSPFLVPRNITGALLCAPLCGLSLGALLLLDLSLSNSLKVT